MIDPRNYLVVDTLRNGTAVTIRVLGPEDKHRPARQYCSGNRPAQGSGGRRRGRESRGNRMP
jgi:hypothetical protein